MGRRHASNARYKVGSVDLIRIVDAAPSVAAEVGESLNVAWSTEFDDLLTDPMVDAVVIAAPTPLHAEMVKLCAAASKHILCEKPIALDVETTVEAIEAARKHNVKLQVGFHRRFDPAWRAAFDRIQAGELGEVYQFHSSHRDLKPPSLERVRASGSIFVDAAIHDFDIARWLVGEIDEITTFGAALSNPDQLGLDNAVSVLRFASGALGVIDNSRVAGYGYDCRSEVMGSKATVRIGHPTQTDIEWLADGHESVDFVRDFAEGFAEAYGLELSDFAEAVRLDKEVAVSGEDGLAAFVLGTAAERSLAEGRTVRLNRKGTGRTVKYSMA
jgi:myo-inositol 2-dehydrogenase/D-chiro-inositol 1-dehydrogenase